MDKIRPLLLISLSFSIGYYHKTPKEAREFISYVSTMISLYIILDELCK